ncbi:MAG: TonB-dependent receptor [Deferribacteres bacterium]|nr:TonB-dependent receptor [candidate division KSB1 bacterium]MCB9500728.1 TonB-dependent receptor [Deferribacteres bacterium]
MWRILVSFLFLFQVAFSQTGTLRGRVTDSETGEPLIGVNVVVKGTPRGAATDMEGYYTISKMDVGGYTLKFTMIGYEEKGVTDVFVRNQKTTFTNVVLHAAVLESGEEIVVTARSYFAKDSETPVSTRMLNYEEVRRSPGAREDISRMIQNLPGVTPSSDDRNDLVVRGGSPSEVLFFVDNIEIPNPNHFGTQGATGGPISMLNTEFIRNVNFIAGGFPAKYGNKTSAVLDISYRKANPEDLHRKVDLNFGGFGANFEGTFAQNNGTWMLAGHRSFLDFMENLIDIGGVPIYSNLQAKVTYQIGKSTQLSLLGIGGDDRIVIDWTPEVNDYAEGEMDTSHVEHIINKTRQGTVGMNLSHVWTERIFSNFTLSHSYNRFFIDYNIRLQETTRPAGKDELEFKTIANGHHDAYDNTSTENVTQLKSDWTWLATKAISINWGIDLHLPQYHHETAWFPFYDVNVVGGTEEPAQVSVKQAISPQTGVYGEMTQKFTHRLTLNAGLRFDHFQLLHTKNWSPRLSLSYIINERLTVSAATGRYFQSPPFIYITGDENNLLNLKSMGSDHFIVGFDYLLAEATLFSVEAYRKYYFDYPVSGNPDFPFYSTANSGADYGAAGGGELISAGKGRGHGIEFLLQKKLVSGIYGLASYTYSKIEHKALDGIYRDGAFDNRHIANIVVGYRLNKNWEFSCKWRYAGGRPYTPIDEQASQLADFMQIDPQHLNEARFDPYSRFDFRYDYRSYFGRYTLVSYFSIENVFNRENQGAVFWNRKTGAEAFSYQTGFFPVGGFSLEF